MGYIVVNHFYDKADNNTFYRKGEVYPKGDYQPSEERIKELSELHPEYKSIFIEAVETEDEKAAFEAEKAKAEEQEKEAIKSELESLGVSFHPNTGLEKLREKLNEAKAENTSKE